MDFDVLPVITNSGPATIIRFFDNMRLQGFEVMLYKQQTDALIEALDKAKYRPVGQRWRMPLFLKMNQNRYVN